MGIKSVLSNLKYRVNILRDRLYEKRTFELKKSLETALEGEDIPVLLVSYNNAIYVQNMTNQLNSFKITPIVIDNNSTDKLSLEILKELQNSQKAKVVYSSYNFGHMVGFLNHIYSLLPEVFAYSDPDLELNKKLPNDFLTILSDLTKEYKVYKAGFALELLEDEQMIDAKIQKLYGVPMIYKRSYTIKEWEEQFWRMKLSHPTLELFAGKIDTTFAVYRKSNYIDFFDGVRVAGDFSALHLPWYPKLDILKGEAKQNYLKANRSSTWLGAVDTKVV